MLRGIAIFSFFALATILVILLQPGPRPAYVYETSGGAFNEASRNDLSGLRQEPRAPALAVPDAVISELKAGAEPRRAQAPVQPAATGTNSAPLPALQAALNASLGTQPVVTDAAPTPTIQAAPQATLQARPSVAVPYQRVAPELRDMSWQTLNALSGLGGEAKAPGQKGSLLNSIVRRSMGKVGDRPITQSSAVQSSAVQVPQADIAQAAPRAAPAQRQARAQGINQSYTVAPGDTLALIAIKLYGSALATDRLLLDNPGLRQNPNALRIGQVLKYSMR